MQINNNKKEYKAILRQGYIYYKNVLEHENNR